MFESGTAGKMKQIGKIDVSKRHRERLLYNFNKLDANVCANRQFKSEIVYNNSS